MIKARCIESANIDSLAPALRTSETKMLRVLFVLTLLWVSALARPSDVLKELIDALEEREMTTRNIYQVASESTRVAIALQMDVKWPESFTMSLNYIEKNMADKPATWVFKDRSWSSLANEKVDWGTLKGSNYAVTVTGLTPNTVYTFCTDVRFKGSSDIKGQCRDVKTKAAKSLQTQLKELFETLTLESKEEMAEEDMSDRIIYMYDLDSSSDAIAIRLQRSISWGNFKMSLYYGQVNAVETAFFTDKTWDQILQMPKPDWGKFKGYKDAVSIGGLQPNTQYRAFAVVKTSDGRTITSKTRQITTTSAKSLDDDMLKELASLLGKD